ncbi:MAG TPA: class I tRNA ligase family protein, partial [Lacipirellula sp.]
IHSKTEIEQYGIERFIHRCQESVWRYMSEWERLTERIGFWVDLKNAYVTYHQSYVESVWWSLKEFFDRGLLYQGHKIVWWWAQGGTALSSGEVGQGYREVADPSIYVKFPLIASDQSTALGIPENANLLVWTTTPWTLPGNQFAAVHPEIKYAVVTGADEEPLIVAAPLVDQLGQKLKKKLAVTVTVHGEDLAGLRYQPPFSTYISEHLENRLRGILGAASPKEATEEFVSQRLCDFNMDPRCEWHLEWKIVTAPFVTTDTGSGIVHIAPAFGEVDFDVLLERQAHARSSVEGTALSLVPELLNPVDPSGRYTDEGPDYCVGRWVKDCDKDIIRDLKTRGRLLHQEQYLHDYPFCWRAEQDPLIQYPRESWFIRTTAFKDAMLKNNAHINWLPEHIKEGRFGKFLESNVDWALSRERFWGTPLPIWVCEQTGEKEAISSYDELLAKPGVTGAEVWTTAKATNPKLPDDLRVHKPYIDAITYDSPFAKGSRMRRVPEVIDVWYDSGSMPFAQWGYRGMTNERMTNDEMEKTDHSSFVICHSSLPQQAQAAEKFFQQFPADFISEALDQTRGWFYSQLAISTMLWGDPNAAPGSARGSASTGADVVPMERGPRPEAGAAVSVTVPYPHPFRTCIVLGLMLGEDGQKMSKSKRNYREPGEIFDRYGADALRWYFFANQPPWTSIRYSEQAIKDSVPEFLLRLWNVYSFFTIYANIDEFNPGDRGQGTGDREDKSIAAGQRPAGAPPQRALSERSELDRWILSELNRTAAAVVERMDAYDNYAACAAITEFVDALSNWYVRRSRDRFWAADKQSPDKLDAYWTLYECLLTTAKLIAPFTPFLAESLWQNLARTRFSGPADEATINDAIPESVHLCDYPTGDPAAIDEQLSEQMNLVRHIASLGRQARTAAGLKVRQPLAKVEVILADATHQKWLEEHAEVIADELNVKAVEFSDQPEKYVEHEVLPNFKLLGPKLGKLMPKVKPTLAKMSGSELLANIRDNGKIDLVIDGQEVALTAEEVEIRLQAKPGWAAANDKGVVVVLATELTNELVQEGLARDFVRVVQDIRKDMGLEFTTRIEIGVGTHSAELRGAIETFREYIAAETLADSIVFERLRGVKPVSVKIGDHEADVFVRAVS